MSCGMTSRMIISCIQWESLLLDHRLYDNLWCPVRNLLQHGLTCYKLGHCWMNSIMAHYNLRYRLTGVIPKLSKMVICSLSLSLSLSIFILKS